MESTRKKPFRILCLDGGGMRGVYQAAFLNELGKVTNNDDIGSFFDLIAGTSTGGIIACGLAKGVPTKTMVELYQDKGPHIFPNQKIRSLPYISKLALLAGFGLRKGAIGLQRALEQTFGESTFGSIYTERRIALVIPSMVLDGHASIVFKTSHLTRLTGRDDNRSLVDACLATSAAPMYRSLAALSEEPCSYRDKSNEEAPDLKTTFSTYVDGGLWANNPSAIAFVEALEIQEDRGNTDQPIELYMLGNIPGPEGEKLLKQRDLDRGAVGWKYGIKAIEASLPAQSIGYEYVAKKLASLRNDGSFAARFPNTQVNKFLAERQSRLDDARPETLSALISQAIKDVQYMVGARKQVGNEHWDQLLTSLSTDIN